mgnify:CR=1 FL=1
MNPELPYMKLQELSQSFFAGDLDKAGREELSEMLQDNTEAREEFEFSRRLHLITRNEDLVLVGAMLHQIIQEEGFPPPPPPKTLLPRPWLWSLLGVVALAALYFTPAYIQHWPPFETSFLHSVAVDNISPLEDVLFTPDDRRGLIQLSKGMDAYNQGNYAEAITLLGYHYAQTNDVNAGLYIGISHLMLGTSEDALQYLNPAASALTGPAREAAQWYQALAQLMNGQKETALQQWQSLQAEGGLYAGQAESLLQLLD